MRSDEKDKPKCDDVSVVFLGAGRPERGESHPGLRETLAGSKVLDWLLQAYPKAIEKRQFVGGYRLNELVKRYHDLQFVENPHWESTGAAGSLFRADLPEKGSLFVSYSDILYRTETVGQLLKEDGDVVVAVDSHWKDRYQGRSREDFIACEKAHLAGSAVTRLGSDLDPELAEAEFIGLVFFKEKALEALYILAGEASPALTRAHLSFLVEALRIKGLAVRAVDVAGSWAELDDPRDLARFVLGTKAQTLDRLRGLVKQSRIEEQFTFTVGKWQGDKKTVLEEIKNIFGAGKVVVRSSALGEDSFSTANAGLYTTVLEVPAADEGQLTGAINKVIDSYSDNNALNQVLVQPMVSAVRASGVVFTRTLERGAPYYVINYDASSGSTASVTAGSCLDEQMLVVRRDWPATGGGMPVYLEGLLPAIREIEGLVSYDSLDIEFAVNGEGLVHIFQVRPIAVDHDRWAVSDEAIYALLGRAEKQFQILQQGSPYVVGKKALFGVMPDWNPAEIIGTNPGLLSASLYRFLVMDQVWATQRAGYGYRDVRPQPLMISFANRPYVDIRASFNSFVPASIDDSLAEKLVNFYLAWLEVNPHLHDKVEFEVVPTCYSLDFARWEKRLQEEGGFTAEECSCLGEALKELTREAIARQNQELTEIKILEERQVRVEAAGGDELHQVYLLLHDCKVYGTLPFAHLARSAFVAVTLLRGAVNTGVISRQAMDDFLHSINTVGNEFTRDALRCIRGELSFKEFTGLYGHLRPGTYDITRPSYGEDPERYLKPILEQQAGESITPAESGALWGKEKDAFFRALQAEGFNFSGEHLEKFMRGAIEGREYAKFVFSRNLSRALTLLTVFGKKMGLNCSDLAHVSIEDLLALRTVGPHNGGERGQWLRERAEEHRALHRLGAAVELSPLLTRERDFSLFSYPPNQANFIGSSTVTAANVDLGWGDEKRPELKGKIAMIPQADPGYDWLFGQKIAGLITMYGGANSHMAIRAAEFGLPAAIGVGEVQYRKLAQARVIELSAENRWLKVIR